MNRSRVLTPLHGSDSPGHRSAVLFVDDEPHVVAGLRDALRKGPYDILTATSAEEALQTLVDHHVDVVVSDEQMPNMTGSQFLGLVRRKYPYTVRIILTGHASLEAAIRAINEGEVYRFLTKPCNPADLAHTIQQGLQIRDLTRESSRLLSRVRRQKALLSELEEQHPGISRVETDERGAILLEDVDVEALIREIERENG
ncbi:MAG: response regulator [Polyangiaceae bacterium]|jgi:DNA-binding NtrC family response regulator